MSPIESNSTRISEKCDLIKFPKWISDEFFRKILNQESNPNVVLKKWTIQLASAKGDNYASIMYRAVVDVENIDGEIISKSYIIKALPESMGLISDEILQTINVFPKEIKMYEQIVPEFERLLRESNDDEIFTPHCLISARKPNPNDLLVMEDLSQFGYKMANRLNGLDLRHTKLILKKLAKFHAASVCFTEHNGPYTGELLKGLYSDQLKQLFESMYDNTIGVLINFMEEWKFVEEYVAKMRMWKPKVIDTIFKLTAVDENEFNVLNHGDLWTNNNMYKYEHGNPINVLFIDLQLSVYGSPSIDLLYFIISSCANDIKVRKFDTFIHYYHKHLTRVLTQLNYKKKIPTLLELHLSIMKRGFMAVLASMTVLPTSLIESCEEASMENLIKSDESAMRLKDKMYNNPRYIQVMQMLLPFFNKKGWLDI